MKMREILFVCTLILSAVVQHQHRHELKFVIQIIDEDSEISNLFLTKKLFIQFFIMLLGVVFQKN